MQSSKIGLNKKDLSLKQPQDLSQKPLLTGDLSQKPLLKQDILQKKLFEDDLCLKQQKAKIKRDQTQKTLKSLCELFLYFMTYTKKSSQNSIIAYKTDLRGLFNFYKIKIPLSIQQKPKLKKQDKKQLEETIKQTIQNNRSKPTKLAYSSLSRKLGSAKSFIKWLAEQNYIEEDFRHLFKSPKIPTRIPVFLSVDEIFAILEMFKKEEGKANTSTDKALFFLLYGGGLRVSEACHVKNKHINWDNRTITIKGKGNKERLSVLPKMAIDSLKVLNSKQDYLFGPQPLSYRKAYDIIKSIGLKTGLLKPLHPHALRHSFATHILLGGGELRILQKLLGHKTLTSTQKYTHLDLAHLSRTLEKYHPLQSKV